MDKKQIPISNPFTMSEGFALENLETEFNIELSLWDNGTYLSLDKIVVPKDNRKKGLGSEIMLKITAYADSVGKEIRLTPDTSFGGTSVNRLKKFYSHFGFVKNTDPEISHLMVRKPIEKNVEESKTLRTLGHARKAGQGAIYSKAAIMSNPKRFRPYTRTKHGLNEENRIKQHIELPTDVLLLSRIFKKENKELYLVGGAVRDAILGKEPKDFDLATNATPDEVIKIANDNNLSVAEVGKDFGVVIVNGHEIATFRSDGSSSDGRRPDSVEFTSIDNDVKRRDLTINALFYDIEKGEVVDLVGGFNDIKNNNIQTVGNPIDRFNEDPLRKLRALRFMGQLNGNLDKATLEALSNDNSLKGVSTERIRDEFIKGLKKAKSTKYYLTIVNELGYLNKIFPELYISKDFIDSTDYIITLARLLRKNNLNELRVTLNKLKYTAKEINDIVFLISLLKFNPTNIYQYKKVEKKIKIDSTVISEFANSLNIDINHYINFNLSVTSNDVPDGITGVEMGNWIKRRESELYYK